MRSGWLLLLAGLLLSGPTARAQDDAAVPPLTITRLSGDVYMLRNEAAKFIGDQMQMPPMVSAIKMNGVPLYKLARKGIEVVREPRLIHIYNFRFTNYSEPLG